jgi:hypothetical protein
MPRVVNVSTQNLNYTAVSFMCNSNQGFKYRDQFNEFKARIKEIVQDDLLGNQEAVEEVFGADPWVDEIKATSFAVEIGHTRNRGHFNLDVEIWHKVPKYSVGKLNDRMKAFLNDKYPLPKGSWNVWTTLRKGGERINYSNKEVRWDENDKTEYDAELERLSDERDMNEVINEVGDMIRALDLAGSNKRIQELKQNKYKIRSKKIE